MRSALLLAGLAALPLAALPAAGHAQSVEAIVEEAIRRYDDRMEGIDNYTIHQSAMGTEMTMRFERRDVDGASVFVPVKSTSSMGEIPLEQAGEQAAYTNPWVAYREWIVAAEVEGETEVDGKDAWLIRMNEFPEEAFNVPGGDANGGEFTPESALMTVDQEDYLVHRVEIRGVITSDGEQRETTMTITMSDYRGDMGMLHPHLMRLEMEGLLDDEQSRQAAEAMAQMEKELEEMDENQRRMVEQMMSAQLEQLRSMLQGGTMEFLVETNRIEVNTPAEG